MEQLNSAVHKYFLNVSMNKIVHHITIAVDLQWNSGHIKLPL